MDEDAARAGAHTGDQAGHVRDVVDDVCDQFESAWMAGEHPDLKSFLASKQNLSEHQAMLAQELLALDIHYRKEAGEVPVAEDYLRQLGTDYRCIRR